MVLGLAAAAVEILVQRARCAAGEVGDDKARIGALGAGLDAGDDALNPAPACGAIVELLVAPQLVCAAGGGLAVRRAALQRLDVPAERAGGGDTENEIHPLGAAEIQHLGGAIIAVSTQQDLNRWPVPTDGADQPEQEAAHLLASWPARRAQHRGDRTAIAVKDDDRLEAVCVVVGVE